MSQAHHALVRKDTYNCLSPRLFVLEYCTHRYRGTKTNFEIFFKHIYNLKVFQLLFHCIRTGNYFAYIGAAFLMLKSNVLKRLLYGRPTVVIRYGKILYPALRKHRVELDELLSELRQKGIARIEDISYAILEENGKLSVFPRTELSPLTPKDASLIVTESGIAHALIIDGTILQQNLAVCGKSEAWLLRWLNKHKTAAADVFLLTLDDGGKVFLMTKADCSAQLKQDRG